MVSSVKAVRYNTNIVTTAVWFGDSWCMGTELEKCMGPDYKSKDQEDYRRENRFSNLVSKHFGWKEVNLAQEGISTEHVTLKIIEYTELQNDLQNQIYFIVWPSFQRYFWINDSNQRQDLRWCSEYKDWYRTVDTGAYQMYCAQRTIWSTCLYLQQHKISYVMVNGQSRVTKIGPFPLQDYYWILEPGKTLGDILDVDLDQGFPAIDQNHRYFWPAENHPNMYGHKKIAKEIINYLSDMRE